MHTWTCTSPEVPALNQDGRWSAEHKFRHEMLVWSHNEGSLLFLSRSRFVPLQVRASVVSALVLLTACPAVLVAQRPPNSNAYYQNLRNLLPGGEVIVVNNFD